MNKDDITQDDLKIIAALNRHLQMRFGLRIVEGSIAHFESVLAHYEGKRAHILATSSETRALSNPDYAKAVLISEGVRLVLREVKPKRRRKRKN